MVVIDSESRIAITRGPYAETLLGRYRAECRRIPSCAPPSTSHPFSCIPAANIFLFASGAYMNYAADGSATQYENFSKAATEIVLMGLRFRAYGSLLGNARKELESIEAALECLKTLRRMSSLNGSKETLVEVHLPKVDCNSCGSGLKVAHASFHRDPLKAHMEKYQFLDPPRRDCRAVWRKWVSAFT
jgi:hypothetical protein